MTPAALAPKPVLNRLKNVTALMPTADGGSWIGTFGSGLYWLGAPSDTLVPVPLGPEDPGALNIDSGALALDRDGTLFVGTFGAGLLRASPRIAGLQTWHERDDDHPGLSNQDVYALQAVPAKDSGKEALLVGSFGGGIDESVPPVLVSADGTFSEGGYSWAPPLNGGFTVLELPSREEAVAWAARIAKACRCQQELRVFGFDPAS